MKDTKAFLLLTVILLVGNLISYGMEYGLRFKSHSFPADERTSLSLGQNSYKFEDEFAFGFEMAFYDPNRFGLIYTVTGNDGTTISLVSSAVDGTYQPGIVINDKLNLIPTTFDATPDNPSHPILILKRHENKVMYIDDKNKKRYTFPVDLSKVNSVKVDFGRLHTQVSVAPVEIQDVRIFIEKQNTHKWALKEHQGDSVYDELNGVLATAGSPHWILDDHMAWTEVFSFKTDEKVQTAFDPVTETFYIVDAARITEFNPISNATRNIKIGQDGRVMKYSNYLTFDTVTNSLLSYSLENRQTNIFDFTTDQWQKNIDSDLEPHYANHGYAEDGRYAYMFGGYGFYLYHNSLVKLNLLTGEMEDITLHPLPDPRTSSALGVANHKLYLFGGMGNSVGKQEIPSKHYVDLWEYDLETMKGKLVWSTDTATYDFLPSQSMYYEPKDTCFYVASTLFGGCMMRVSPKRPGYEVVSQPIHSKMDFRDCVFNLYRSAHGGNFYLVIDKRQNDFSHEYSIYHIAYPFKDALVYDVYRPKNSDRKSFSLMWWLIGGVVLAGIILGVVIILRRNRGAKGNATVAETAPSSPTPSPGSPENTDSSLSSDAGASCAPSAAEDTAPATTATASAVVAGANEEMPSQNAPSGIEKEESEAVMPAISAAATEAEAPKRAIARKEYFDMSKSSISLLGKFEVKDMNGVDITPKFTARIKDLLVILLLYSEKDEKGISYETLDEVIWGDKDEKSAKNNRNVYMRKLRLLLEEVGNVEIIYDKGYYRIEPKEGVVIDYHEIMTLLNSGATASQPSPENLDKTLELLLHGPLLPNLSYDWVDEFKSRFSSVAIQLLTKEMERKENMADRDLTYKIAETISRHDVLSEEALTIKCRILAAKKMKGVAKNAYDAFCQEYKRSYGEDYPVPFAKIIQP